MLKLLKGLDQPPTIINTELIKSVQCTKIGYFMKLFMNEGYAGYYTKYPSGIVLQVDYKCEKYQSEAEVIEDFLNFLNGPESVTDEFGICPIEL